jgi:uncharacterized protein GlcG (DUF336 family)
MFDSKTEAAIGKSVDLDAAHRVIAAAREKAQQLGLKMNIAVVCAGGHLRGFERMDGAWLGSIRIAQDKAFSARAFDMETKALGKMSQPGEPLFGINTTNDGRIVIFAGGIPLKDGSKVAGAIGVSGGTPDQDQEVAEAGAKAF